jgi:hypothetical protein
MRRRTPSRVLSYISRAWDCDRGAHIDVLEQRDRCSISFNSGGERPDRVSCMPVVFGHHDREESRREQLLALREVR